MKKEIIVRVVEGFQVFNYNESELLSDVDTGEELTAILDEVTEEYFAEDSQGREVYVGAINMQGDLQLDEDFVLIS